MTYTLVTPAGLRRLPGTYGHEDAAHDAVQAATADGGPVWVVYEKSTGEKYVEGRAARCPGQSHARWQRNRGMHEAVLHDVLTAYRDREEV